MSSVEIVICWINISYIIHFSSDIIILTVGHVNVLGIFLKAMVFKIDISKTNGSIE